MGATKSQMQNLLIYLFDAIGITIGYFLASHIRMSDQGKIYWAMNLDIYYRWVIALLVLTLIYLLFHPNQEFFKRKFQEELINNLRTSIVLAAGIAMIEYMIKDAQDFSRFVFLFMIAFTLCWMQITHRCYRRSLLHSRKNGLYTRNITVITTSDRAKTVLTNIMEEKVWDLWVSGVVIIDKDMTGQKICDVPVVAHDYRSIFEYATYAVVDEVFICLPSSVQFPVEIILQNFEDMGIKVSLSIPQLEINQNLNRSIEKIGSYDCVSYSGREVSLVMLILKRLMDIIGALVGLGITAIAVVIVGPLIKLESPGPLFFSQKRVGKNGRIFHIYKFRSMYEDAEERKKELMSQNEMEGLMFKMKDDPRITKMGKFIRKTNIDELPQFWNVLKGDMSLVGTRPPTVDEFQQYMGYHKKRLCMTPGLTGVWQVSGRSTITNFEEIVKMDVDYIEHWSLKRDIEIIFKIVWLMFSGNSGAR